MKAKKLISILAVILLSALLTYVSGVFRYEVSFALELDMSNSLFHQKVVKSLEEPEKISVLYYKDKLMGVINDQQKLSNLLVNEYKQYYEKQYPNTRLGLSDDIHVSNEYTLEQYENKDDEILAFIHEHALFSIETNQITFSNGSVLFVKNLEDYESGKQEYVANFVNPEHIKKSDQKQTYGSVVTAFSFEEKVAVNKGYAAMDEILQNSDEVVQWFFSGYDDSKVIYTVENGDTVQGVASKSGLEVNNLIAMNKDVLSDEYQLLEAGLQLNVKGIHSPVHLKVIKEATNKVTIYPENPMYIEDNTLALGVEKIVQEEILGYQKEVVKETYLNGVLVDNEKISSTSVGTAQRMMIRKGTKKSDDGQGLHVGIDESISAGNFRYPVDNASITCGWLCYRGHTAMDVKNVYNRYGEVVAADSGTIIVNDYNRINGNWMEIDHGNGFVTYYGHMNEPGFVKVGEHVEKGQVIGQIGMSGVATGPHVHFEIRYQGEKMDPAMYLK
ncbi:MAG: LysM peptidoglycan-binding domain-containing protein [Erysipelotrichia bacterium]|nr:LysM peptidoglycan-binding domain-containing protein [Erysipelotrichia bacterium]NCC54053.1 LysM peptidoglycan-binding domain-containing protein [Erysipelotrichia bacterium]